MEQDVLVQHDRSSLDPMAFLVEISAIWGDVLEHICRSAYIPSATYATAFEDFYQRTVKRTDQWLASLPSHFTYSNANMERNILAGKTDTFVAVHILYHAAMMKLNRHARHNELSDDSIDRNVRGARHHAKQILRITLALTQFNETGRQAQVEAHMPPARPRITFSTPLTGYAILSAADVLSAAGSLADMSEYITLINSGLDVIEELARFFHSGRVQLRVIEPRIEEMIEVAGKQARLHDKLGFAVEGRPLDAILLDKLMPTDDSRPASPHSDAAARRGDLVYCLPRDRYFQALGMENISVQKGSVLWIRGTESR
jgi:hypothetical protein